MSWSDCESNHSAFRFASARWRNISLTLSTAGARKTDNCADGYTGGFCSQCATGFFSDGAWSVLNSLPSMLGTNDSCATRCQSCGLDSAERSELIGVVIAAAVLMGSIAEAIAFMNEKACARRLLPLCLTRALA